MASGLYFVIVLLWTFQCEGSLSVQDESSILIAFGNEPVATNCTATMACKPEYADFEIKYYRIDPEGNEIVVQKRSETQQIPSGCHENKTEKRNYKLCIEPISHASVTGTYYCEVAWKTSTVRGNGTYILFRDKGFIEPLDILQMTLITLVIILVILSIAGTALLHWKRKDLDPHQSDIYLTLEKNANSSSHKKMPISKMSQQETQGGSQDVYENHITELYENI
ncbi:hypothetical protein JRQ81_016186 [Phrynocephalus forsythii]|uniref:NFAM1 Ig-like domain-containing protein n=1 Tax=Phrynocephalus forsythii TaxID=171643 RepID=A0A9Q0XXZ5_9SAUR|nr:hypothetical protein JRQ81_016186 [Phrynocephalus forsythii]